jgi:hypothetical protein
MASDDFEFSDDALDHLPEHTFRELEQNAFAATQAPPRLQHGENAQAGYRVNNETAAAQAIHRDTIGVRPQSPSAGYGYDNEDLIEIEEGDAPLPVSLMNNARPEDARTYAIPLQARNFGANHSNLTLSHGKTTQQRTTTFSRDHTYNSFENPANTNQIERDTKHVALNPTVLQTRIQEVGVFERR